MATLVTTSVTSTGASLAGVAASSGGDLVEPGVLLVVNNGDESAMTVTLVTAQTVDGDLDVADRDVEVAAGASMAVRVPSSYRDPETGLVAVEYSSVTDVSVAALK